MTVIDLKGKCWCGRPLHYNSLAEKRMVAEIVERFGEYINVKMPEGKTYRAQRHYIALHGINNKDLSALGFQETG